MTTAKKIFNEMDLEQIRSGQEDVAFLLDREKRIESVLAEISALADVSDRLDEGATLWMECTDLTNLCKEMEGVISRVRKRLEKVQAQIKVGLEDEFSSIGEPQVETHRWIFSEKLNPPKVIVDDLGSVPKKYRLAPKPIPPWQEWDVDKNGVKQALVKEIVKSIDGLHIERGTRLDIKIR